ncbi:MAG: DUF3619 family protein [Casimicrobiaceae bacterium]
MNLQNEQELARKITERLGQGSADLRQGTAYRLQSARQAALARMAERADSPKHAPALALATAGGSGTVGRTRSFVTDYRLWLAILVVAGGLYMYNYWTVLQQAGEIAELDSALLGSDLPFDAFLDKGFENWLNRSGQ